MNKYLRNGLIGLGLIVAGATAEYALTHHTNSKTAKNHKSKTEKVATVPKHDKKAKDLTSIVNNSNTGSNTTQDDRMQIDEVYMHDGVAYRFGGYGPRKTLRMNYMDYNIDSENTQQELVKPGKLDKEGWKLIGYMSIDQFPEYAKKHAIPKKEESAESIQESQPQNGTLIVVEGGNNTTFSSGWRNHSRYGLRNRAMRGFYSGSVYSPEGNPSQRYAEKEARQFMKRNCR